MMSRSHFPLPIDAYLPEILAALSATSILTLKASTGSGKTTRVPAALLTVEFAEGREIWVLEPRRLAAKWAAQRVSDEMDEKIGETVGYQFRFEKRESPKTRLRFLTEGILLRKLKTDPTLSQVAAVVLDEFHERHLTTDLALTCLLDLQRRLRPDLKILIMSATLDIKGLQQTLGTSSSSLEIEAPRFPVDIRYLNEPLTRRLDEEVARQVHQLLQETTGDILIFLPGMGEILRAKQSIESQAQERMIEVIPLHGELSREEQDRAMLPSPLRKIILSTNLAESSITIPGITAVIDSGLHRQASHSHWNGIPALRTRPISKASATQRSGRAGRTAPGICQRLYTRADFDGRAAMDTPEILRADLAQVLLDLKAMNIPDIPALPWIESPPPSQWEAAARLLWLLGILSSKEISASLTDTGQKLSGLSMHPRLMRLLFDAAKSGQETLSSALTLAAYLSEGELPSRSPLESHDVLQGQTPSGFALRRAVQQWSDEIQRLKISSEEKRTNPSKKDLLAKCILRAFPDQVVRVLPDGSLAETTFSGSIEIHPELRGSKGFAVALESQERQQLRYSEKRSLPMIESWILFPEEWLFDLEPGLLSEFEGPWWDDSNRRTRWVSELRYGNIMLSRSEREPNSETEWKRCENLLLKETWKMEIPDQEISVSAGLELVLALRNLVSGELSELIESTLARLLLIREQGLVKESLPKFTELFSGALSKKLSHRQLAEMDWESEIQRAILELRPQLRLEEWTPSHVLLAGGRRARVQYRLGHAPWVESRLQDFFGMKQGPRVLAGRLALTLHLLAPNQRAVQVTQDLAGFWERVYPELRNQLMRRYPRHSWPERP
ncbi:MAG: ATP-dependent helicase HrpB [Bdellovibrionales bacterium]|nr:ATP-dependent helicase HrpB [Bdellovibrionales bacterium]